MIWVSIWIEIDSNFNPFPSTDCVMVSPTCLILTLHLDQQIQMIPQK